MGFLLSLLASASAMAGQPSRDVRPVLWQLERLEQEKSRLRAEVAQELMLQGDVYFRGYAFAPALEAYEKSLGYVRAEDSPELWARLQVNRARTHRELGRRAAGAAVDEHLRKAEAACRQVLEKLEPARWPEPWAQAQGLLGEALRELGMRTEGKARDTLLAASVKAWRQALKLYTREQQAQQRTWVQQELGKTLNLKQMPSNQVPRLP
ncbi:hypothetical protein ATI61_11073 [Archangium gephyra]|uniref:Argininosuccinate lyase n=1 Tax=Archangium gephyra TaxID=48 RepID=A0AAC8QEX4_9BACT|nr:hypothetical protein [Archangium gephyra]AKJ06184.1 Argininosuccinate lyase [Archangium gephyra]REG27066.1 hypothetical protein ATI61_11073 [Archangium gephyra]